MFGADSAAPIALPCALAGELAPGNRPDHRPWSAGEGVRNRPVISLPQFGAVSMELEVTWRTPVRKPMKSMVPRNADASGAPNLQARPADTSSGVTARRPRAPDRNSETPSHSTSGTPARSAGRPQAASCPCRPPRCATASPGRFPGAQRTPPPPGRRA